MKPTQNDKVFELYKPLRNRIQKFNLLDCLYLIWAYSRNYTFKHSFPSNIELPIQFNPSKPLSDKRLNGILEHEMEFLIREFVIHCHNRKCNKSLLENQHFCKVINYLRGEFENGLSNINNEKDIILELNKMSHRQFRWQSGNNKSVILRNFKIYSHPELAKLVKSELGLTIHELFLTGIYLFYVSGEHFKISYPILSENEIISTRMFEQFLHHFASDVLELKSEMIESYRMDDTIIYSYNPINAKPILIYENSIICPIHLLVLWQFTTSLYYKLVGKKGFDHAFGSSFEDYIGNLLKGLLIKPNFSIKSEFKYDNFQKKSSDWIISDTNAIIFLECKTKRMTMASKSETDTTKGLSNDIYKMATFIVQLYKTFEDYRNDKYKSFLYDETKLFVPIVVTLEPWYVDFNIRIMPLIHKQVIIEFNKYELDSNLLEKYPYYIKSCENLEIDLQLINELGILEFFHKTKNNTIIEFKKTFNFTNSNEIEFKELFLDYIENNQKL